MEVEVEVREEAFAVGRASSRYPPAPLGNNTPGYPIQDVPVVVVRVEEVLLVALVLVIWVAAIALFFNRWGKIRMLEPYQPKFCQQPHRASCPLAPLSPPGITNQARMSFSKYNVNALTDPLSVLPSPIIRRPRQNSVFVGSTCIAMLNPPPRRSKSAVDIQHLVVNEHSPTASLSGNKKGSIVPILNKDRRTSLITIERAHYTRHRPSITVDRPYIHHHRARRLSCLADRAQTRHKNFMSFEHSFDRKTQPTIEETPSCSYHHAAISFETPLEAAEVEEDAKRKFSRSFEQPGVERAKPERMANSMDVSGFQFDRRCSIPEEDRASPVSINLDDSKVMAPLLEGLKSSDV